VTREAATLSPPKRDGRIRHALRTLGPGLITGAADDDPSGISTYSQAGAAFGFGLLWTALISLPLMAAIELMCARIGLVTKRGLASVLRAHYPPWVLWLACGLLVTANTINIAADLSGMAAAAQLLIGVRSVWFTPAVAALLIAVLVFSSYDRLCTIFKWLTLVLFAYVGAAVLARPPWMAVLRGTVVPHVELSREYWFTFVAILGTTISPYLLFWQASQEVEEKRTRARVAGHRARHALKGELRDARTDVTVGMFFSNLVMYFIILTAGATLHAAGQRDVQTAAQAASALRPLAGNASALLFSLGIIGTGLLGVPVLAGSAGYAIAEAGAWRRGMDARPYQAKHFYGVIAGAIVIGTVLALTGIDAITMLIGAAVINGLLAPPLIAIVLVVCNDAEVMGTHRNGWRLNALGTIATAIMTAAAIMLIWSMM
jgi:NRAMP (natural resistance-associated macrophage protein)-like metal ion transporter